MLSCKEVTCLLAGDELEKANWGRRLAVRIHLRICRHCRRYAAQLQAIGRAARSLWGVRPADEDLEALKRLEEAILKGVSRGSTKK